MSKEMEGTVRDLYKLRAAYASAGDMVKTLKEAGLDATPTKELQADLGDTTVYIDIPCIVCKKGYPVAVRVDEDGWPSAVLCEACNAKIEAEIAVAGSVTKAKRKRRTKAEMEAARQAKAAEKAARQQAESGG